MSDFIFYFSAIIVLPFWFSMIIFPKSDFTEKLVSSPWIIVPPVICYLYFLLPNIFRALSEFNQISPGSMAKMMSEPWAAGMYWAYAGAFDLFIGRWIYFDAREKGFSYLLISPVLFISIFFGPVGFALYALLNLFQRKIRT